MAYDFFIAFFSLRFTYIRFFVAKSQYRCTDHTRLIYSAKKSVWYKGISMSEPYNVNSFWSTILNTKHQILSNWLWLFFLSRICVFSVGQKNKNKWINSINLLLCLNTRMVEPERRAPRTRDAWLSSSLKIRQP